MRPTRIAVALLALGAFSNWGSGYAADAADFGKVEYERKCAVCHGLKGKGDGPYAVVGMSVPDLTTLSKRNKGVFPVQHLNDVIDGTEILAAHGTRNMPIWGTVYRAQVEEVYFDAPPFAAEVYAHFRILALIDYISRLQAR
jgi:mono/diheme cytochrome c family protein